MISHLPILEIVLKIVMRIVDCHANIFRNELKSGKLWPYLYLVRGDVKAENSSEFIRIFVLVNWCNRTAHNIWWALYSKRTWGGKASRWFLISCSYRFFLLNQNELALILLVSYFLHVNIKVEVKVMVILLFQDKDEPVRIAI